MKATSKKKISAVWKRMLKACNIAFDFNIRVEAAQPEEDKDDHPDRQTIAAVSVYGKHVVLSIYPRFFRLDFKTRVESLAHEMGHVILHPIADAAEGFAGDNESVMTQIEERLCDELIPFVLAMCNAKRVSFNELKTLPKESES